MHNPDCDGNGPHDAGEARVLPLAGPLCFKLCKRCFGRELRWRYERNRGLGVEARYSLPSWESLARVREAERVTFPHRFTPNRSDTCTICGGAGRCRDDAELPEFQDSRTQADGMPGDEDETLLRGGSDD